MYNLALGVSVAQWIEHFPPKEGVSGSIPDRDMLSVSSGFSFL